MDINIRWLAYIGFILTVTCYLSEGRMCNEVLCASVVSKCMLTQACKCEISRDPEKCKCCVDCVKCLGQFFQRCCTCLEMCDEDETELDPNDSQVGDIGGHFLELYNAIVEETKETIIEGVLVKTWPVEWKKDELRKKLNRKNLPQGQELSENRIQVNCSVAYMSQCHSAVKCREECKKIGAGSYRYFFDGCCQCVGATCINYGINKSQCRECSNIGQDYKDGLYADDPSVVHEGEQEEKVNSNMI